MSTFQAKGIKIFANEAAKNEQRNVRNDSAHWNWGIWESDIGSEMGHGSSLCDENIGEGRCDSGGLKNDDWRIQKWGKFQFTFDILI